MSHVAAVPVSALDAIRDVVGAAACIEIESDKEPYLTEQRGLWRGECDMIVRPGSAQEVSAVLKICSDTGTVVVPQGGNTGLLGGAVPHGGIVLSLSRMNRIRAIDALNHTMTVEAGCVLQTIQEAANEAGCLFPLSLGAEGSCQIGGNLATNAGGVNVLRYGNTRDLVLGIEAVLPDGRIWNGLRGLRKDNTGYNLKHLFIGSEGTLGVITAAVLKLFPEPRSKETAFVAMPDPKTVLTLFDRVRAACGDNLTAFEMIPRLGVEFACRHIAGVTDPMDRPHPFYALIEVSSPRAGEALRDTLEAVLSEAFEAGQVEDAVLAASEAQARDLWRIRESIPEAQKGEGGSIKHDVAVPVSRVPELVSSGTAMLEKELPGCRVLPFGHVGDGNIHFNISQPIGADTAAFMAQWDRINHLVHDLVEGMGGTFSAEHGIGAIKRGDLSRYKSPVEMSMMHGIKTLLDPKGIMNPGKVL